MLVEKIGIIHDGQEPKNFSVVKYNDMGVVEKADIVIKDLQHAVSVAEDWAKNHSIELDTTVKFFKYFTEQSIKEAIPYGVKEIEDLNVVAKKEYQKKTADTLAKAEKFLKDKYDSVRN